MDEIEQLEQRLRALDEQIARLRHELIWRKRGVRPGYEPIGLEELEARYLALSDEFTATWKRWQAANAVNDAAEAGRPPTADPGSPAA
ncbi:MAG: hypothetical protein K6U89_04700 [Chloroflexi bacterium]|nr:hypothetical protein [Chloroflexota bacterium]